MKTRHPNQRATRIAFALAGLVWASAGAVDAAGADASPARPLVSPAAVVLRDDDASQYWDLTSELESGHRIFARFQITNQGPGDNNATAIGHVIAPNGKKTKFRNGRLESGWTLSEDRLDLDVGKSHLDMHSPRYRLKVNKDDVRIRLKFAPNVLTRIPKKVTGKRYSVDLLALGAATTGSLRLEEGGEEIELRGATTLSHTIARRDEVDLALRRIELIHQTGPRPLYAVQFHDDDGDETSWAAWLGTGCDPAFDPRPFPDATASPAAAGTKPGANRIDRCIRRLESSAAVRLVPRIASLGRSKRDDEDAYWNPPRYRLESIPPDPRLSPPGAAPEPAQALQGEMTTVDKLLKYEALDDLPGPIRFVARLSTRPLRIWSLTRFEVTLPPSLDPEATSIQGQGVAVVSFLNPVTKP